MIDVWWSFFYITLMINLLVKEFRKLVHVHVRLLRVVICNRTYKTLTSLELDGIYGIYAVYTVVVCQSVCLSVCVLHVGIVSKWVNIG